MRGCLSGRCPEKIGQRDVGGRGNENYFGGPFYREDGGVTISGGEALVQWEFTLEILKRCKVEGIHTCVESALGVHREVIDRIIPHCDMIITDIKHMNSDIHKKYTSIGNELILENIQHVVKTGTPVVIRLPIIPDVNDDMENAQPKRILTVIRICS